MHLIFIDNSKFRDYFQYNEEDPITYIPHFNRINIIIGANNSGKSRFIRNLMCVKNYKYVNENTFEDYNNLVSEFNKKVRELHGRYFLEKLSLDTRLESIKLGNAGTADNNRYGFEYSFRNKFSEIGEVISHGEFKRIYFIPTLRTAHSLFEFNKDYRKIERDIYLDSLIRFYNLDTKSIEIFTGIHLYKEILNTRNSKREVRKLFDNFEKFISKFFFSGKAVDIVAEFNKDESLKGENHSEIISVHIEGETDTRKLYELGDGIQAIIILMYKIFMAEPDSVIFIDEPELNLHPGMQRLFLEQIYSNQELTKKNLTYVISTHSNHFLDLTLEKDDVSIYAFSPKNTEEGKDKEFVIRNVNRGDNSILRDLGVNNSSVFLANCSIWVEGVSDRNYIKAFLKSYIQYLYKTEPEKYKSLKEDIDYAFFEYAGSNIEHYVFNEIEGEESNLIAEEINALALSNKIFLLADSDNAKKSEKKGKRLEQLEALKRDNFHPKVVWGIREIENLLTNEIWKNVLINFCRKDLIKVEGNNIQIKIDSAFHGINSTDYSKKYVGEFLNEIRNRVGKEGANYILNESIYEKKDGVFGTFIQKRELSEAILNADFEWSVFAENSLIVELTEEIYNFIIS